MTNLQVIKSFLNKESAHTPTREIINGIYGYQGQTLRSNGLELINYSTRIAYHEDGKLYLNVHKYSVTTSKIQNQLRAQAQNYGMDVIEYEI